MQSIIEGNAAMVTASSSGPGKDLVTVLAERDVTVVVDGRDEDQVTVAMPRPSKPLMCLASPGISPITKTCRYSSSGPSNAELPGL